MLTPLRGSERDYAWGSVETIPELLGQEPTGKPVAELWFGAHPAAPSTIEGADGGPANLREHLRTDPSALLGSHVHARFGHYLPFLLKLIAPARPLSLQVHPDLAQARAGFDREEAAGMARDAPERLYKDPNHKPELIYALTPFQAVCGFRTPRRAAELVSGLEVPLTERLTEILRAEPTATGVRAAVTALLTPGAVQPEEVAAVVAACAQRQGARTGSVRVDRIVAQLGRAYPGDPGAVAALLLNPVTLRPGEAMFVPAGFVHAYLDGFGVELMANSDNVLRAGLTSKHVDPAALLEILDCVAAPPMRIAPEVSGATQTYYAPVEDFELSITQVGPEAVQIPGRGPRILLVIEGRAEVSLDGEYPVELTGGRAVFAPATAGPVQVRGSGRVVQAGVP